ncbi:MAG: glycoside hydrolase family 76 protein [Candidatus Limnocylindrales bacterium]
MLVAIMPVLALAGLFSHHFGTSAAGSGRVAPSATLAASAASTRAATLAASAASTLAATRARVAIDSFDRAFYSERNGKGHFAETAGGAPAKFWKQAEMMEAVEDAYERSGNPTYRRMIRQLHAGVIARYGKNWLRDPYNDDIMWMVVAFLRAYELTGDTSFRTQAKWHFDRVYARARSTDFGGGLWWTTSRQEKNACVTGPSAIAASLLFQALGDRSYLSKATTLFAWLDSTLYDPASGAVYDHVCRASAGGPTLTDRSTYTYNQGTFVGAADLLYQETGRVAYYDEALAALRFTQADMTVGGGILKSEGSGGDGGGFKGIFVRWATRFTKVNGITAFNRWFDRNADAAWAHRNRRNLTGENWSIPTRRKLLHSFDCSSAVAMMQDRP